MDPEKDKTYIRIHKKALLLVMILILIISVGLFGWWIGSSNGPSDNEQIPSGQASTKDESAAGDVTSLVSYTLPDGWRQANCEGSGAVYILPNGISGADCGANPVSPVKLSVDPSNHTDCNQLQNVSEVKKHVCVSLYINGKKSLKASTEYLASSSYKQPTTINAYYVDTGKGVVKLEYIFTTDNQFQAGFDQLANSIQGNI